MRLQWGARVLLLTLLVTGDADARDGDDVTVFGIGTSTCGTMTDDVARSESARQEYEDYIDGFLTAVNLSFPGKSNFFPGIDQAARYKFVLQYCETNPLDRVISAIQTLVKRYKDDFPPR